MRTIATETRTTIVNAAFLQEVKESNPDLWAILRDLRALDESGLDSKEASRVLVEKLNDLRDCIGLQFSLEETYGFIEGSPLSMQIGVANAETAKMQHRELYLQLHELCEEAEEAQYRGTISRDLPMYLGAFEVFDGALRAHEDLEEELIRCGLGVNRLSL